MSTGIIWPIEPHTQAKHEILRYYLGAWFPILTVAPRRILYVDGFAGPGEYAGGEDGSPIIALKVAKDHMLVGRLQRVGVEIVFFFIERDSARCSNLQKKIAGLSLPSNFRINVECNTFEDVFGKVITSIEEQGKRLAPSFIFIDPFGPTGFPMSLVRRIAKQPKSELLINFNFQALNQWFLSDESKHIRVDELYGGAIWREALKMSSVEKEDFLVDSYRKSLEGSGWKVRHFRMKNKHNQTQYYLFFATANPLGMLAMKRAMWSAAPTGDFYYSDLVNPAQARLFENAFDDTYARDLVNLIFQKRSGHTIRKEDLKSEELAWHPICIERHLTAALRILEAEGKIKEVKVPNRIRRKNTFPEDCTIDFLHNQE